VLIQPKKGRVSHSNLPFEHKNHQPWQRQVRSRGGGLSERRKNQLYNIHTELKHPFILRHLQEVSMGFVPKDLWR